MNQPPKDTKQKTEEELLLLDFCKFVGENTPSYSVMNAKQLIKSYFKHKETKNEIKR